MKERPRLWGRIERYTTRAEVRDRPLTTVGRRIYFEVVSRAAPRILRRPHRSRLRGTTYRVRAPLSESIGRSLFLYGVYEPVASLVFACLLRDGDVAVDVGAHYGDFCLLAANQVGRTGVVYAFEPQSAVRDLLVANLRANNIDNTRVFDCALSDHEGEANLYPPVDRSNTGGASLLEEQAGQANQYVRVPVRELDDVVERAHLERLTAIKVDVEGAEAEVLRGARSVLAVSRPAVMFEVNGLLEGPAGIECEAFHVLEDSGYTLYGMVVNGATPRLEPFRLGDDPTRFREPWLALNLLALHPDSLALRRVASLIE